MANVEIKAVVTFAAQAGRMRENAAQEANAKPLRRCLEQREQILRCLWAQDAPEPLVLDDGLGTVAEMFQIGQAHAVYAGRQAASPATPDQPGRIEQEGSVIRQGGSRTCDGWLPIPRSPAAVNVVELSLGWLSAANASTAAMVASLAVIGSPRYAGGNESTL
jgi:hypothetical protein